MAKTPHDFYLAVIGKAFDIDHYYGPQCWDGAMYYSQWLGYPRFSCTSSGYVKDIWNLRKTSGILKYYNEVKRPFQDGDIIVWRECGQCPLSHIAIFRKDNGNGTFVALGQNQGGAGGAFNQRNFTYDGVMGGLRPKCYAGGIPGAAAPKPSGKAWTQNCVLRKGDRTKSVSCAIQGIQGNCVRCDALGGLVPLAHVSEARDTRDGACDNYLATTNARITLDECTVQAVKPGYAMVHGYWVKAGPLMGLR